MATLEDKDAQMKGVCDVAYVPGDVSKSVSFKKFADVMRTGGDMLMNLPCRITGYHFCYNDPRLQYILSMACRAFGKEMRLRLRTHYGSHLEIQYSLMTFGIQCKSLIRGGPALEEDDDEDEKHNNYTNGDATKMHQRYLERRLQIEAKTADDRSNTGGLLYPNPNDVLVGRGRPYREYSGNQRWSRLIDALLEKHHRSADRFAKTCITMDVVKTVHERGGRFLSRTSTGWEVLDDLTAREKTASGFRTRQVAKTAAAAVSSSGGGFGGGSVKRLRHDPGLVN
jgi:hypothetical protein